MFMRKFMVFLVLVFSLNLSAKIPQLSRMPVPDWVEPVTAPKTTIVNTGAVAYQLVDSQVNMLTPQKQHFLQIVKQPRNSQGLKDASELSFDFYPSYEQLIFHEITIIRNGQEIPQLDLKRFKLFQNESELDNKLYNEKWTALFILDDVRPNDLIRFQYTTVGQNPILDRHDFGRLYLDWSIPIAKMNIELLSPKSLRFHFSHKKYDVKKTKMSDGIRYSLQINNIEARPNESQYPYWYDPYNLMQYSAIRSWKEVVDWAKELYQLDYSLPTALKQKMDTWKKELGKDVAIEKAISLVQNDIRYFGIEFGINSHKPRTPKKVFEQRYGDCKDKAALIVALLKYLGVRAYPALVNSSKGPQLENYLPSPFAFDHVITYYENKNKKYWVDGTVNMQGTGSKSRGFYDYKKALIIRSGENDLSVMSPTYERSDVIKIDSNENYKVNVGERNASLNVLTLYRGLKAEQMRRYLSGETAQNIKSYFENYYSTYYQSVKQNQPYKMVDDIETNLLSVDEKYQLNNVVKPVSGRDILKINASVFGEYLYKPEVINRTTPLALNHPLEISHKETIDVVGEILWNEPEKTEVIKNKWFEFSRNVLKKEKSIIVNYRFETLSDHVTAKNMDKYLEEINKLDGYTTYSMWVKPKIGADKSTKKRVKNMIKSLLNK